jgi:hypothetical protein
VEGGSVPGVTPRVRLQRQFFCGAVARLAKLGRETPAAMLEGCRSADRQRELPVVGERGMTSSPSAILAS